MSDLTDQPTRFADLEGVHERTVEALERRGMTHAFPVQAAVVPIASRGNDVLVQSPTGSGKTLAFGLPIIDRIEKNTMRPTALVLVPTRELAVQVTEDLAPLATGKQLRCVSVYGGAPIQKQAIAVKTAAIVVATPGRLDDLIRNRKIDLRGVTMLVLDEADRMLDMGFQPQVDAIVDAMPVKRQTMLFSATLEGAVAKVAATYTSDAEIVRTAARPGEGGKIEHRIWATTMGTKVDVALEVLEGKRDLAVVFVRTQRSADTLCGRLREHGVRATAIHGGMSQRERLTEYRRFQDGACDVLVATDVFARGMDLDRITLVLNYDLPEDADTYRHRSGRTGRAGREGLCVTMVTNGQRKPMRRMMREAEIDLKIFDDVRHVKRTGRTPLPVSQHYVPETRGGRPKAKQPFERGHRGSGASSGYVRAGAPVVAGGPGDGRVISYDPQKGFGFIKADAGGEDVFFHRNGMQPGEADKLEPGTRVSFATQKHERGVRACDVTVAGPGTRPSKGDAPRSHSRGPKVGGSVAPWKKRGAKPSFDRNERPSYERAEAPRTPDSDRRPSAPAAPSGSTFSADRAARSGGAARPGAGAPRTGGSAKPKAPKPGSWAKSAAPSSRPTKPGAFKKSGKAGSFSKGSSTGSFAKGARPGSSSSSTSRPGAAAPKKVVNHGPAPSERRFVAGSSN